MIYQDWLENSGISKVTLGQWQLVPPRTDQTIGRVQLTGEYAVHQQHESARVLRMAVSAALAASSYVPIGIVLDLRELTYFGGDTLLSWENFTNDSERPRGAFLCSDSNYDSIKSLLDDQGDEDWTRAFKSEEEALAWIASERQTR